MVAEEVVVPPRSQYDVSSKMLYCSLVVTSPARMTETEEIEPRVRAARVVTEDQAQLMQVRVTNLGEQPVKLCRDQVVGVPRAGYRA